jgi:hypothetical protein
VARVYRVVVGLAVLYVLALVAFSRLHYGDRPTPDVAGVARDFHRWIGERLPRGARRVDEPGAVPPRREREALPPTPGR